MGRGKSKDKKTEYTHLAVSVESKKRFEYLKIYIISPEKPTPTQDELLIEMMNLFENHYSKKFKK